MSSGSHDDDEASQKAAFAAFMLQGKVEIEEASSSSKQPELQSNRSEVVRFNRERKYQSLHKAFASMLVVWTETHAYLRKVVESLADLRRRIGAAQKLLDQQKDHPNWKRPHHVLAVSDIEIALFSDIRAHERTFIALRSNLVTLQDDQDLLSRRLEDLMKYHMDIGIVSEDHDVVDDEVMSIWAERVFEAEMLTASTATELYRLQELAPTLLSLDNHTGDIEPGSNAFKTWATTSFSDEVANAMDKIQNLGTK